MSISKGTGVPFSEKLEKYGIFLRWWLFFSLVSFGTAVLLWAGVFEKVNQGDVTKISFLIFSIFVIFTIRTGIDTYNLCTEDDETMSNGKLSTYLKKSEIGWFTSDILVTLGMIGTVLGFIYMLSTSFSQVDAGNIGSMQNMVLKMGTGMSTALYTTAAGLVCSLFLKLQLFNFSNRLEFLAERGEPRDAPKKLL